MSLQTMLLPTIVPTGRSTMVETQRSPRQIAPQHLNHKQLERSQITALGMDELPGLRHSRW